MPGKNLKDAAGSDKGESTGHFTPDELKAVGLILNDAKRRTGTCRCTTCCREQKTGKTDTRDERGAKRTKDDSPPGPSKKTKKGGF